MGTGLKYMFIAVFFKASSKKKIKLIIFIVWFLRRIDKMPKKGSWKWKKYFFVLNKYHSVTHVSTWIFQGLFKYIVFGPVALVTKKLWALRFFFYRSDFFSGLYPTPLIKKNILLIKNPLTQSLLGYLKTRICRGGVNLTPPLNHMFDVQIWQMIHH